MLPKKQWATRTLWIAMHLEVTKLVVNANALIRNINTSIMPLKQLSET
jgi:hypothetical protein